MPQTKNKKESPDKDEQNGQSSWLNVIENEAPRFHCPVIQADLMGPCNLRGCVLWTSNPRSYNCVGAYSSVKAVNSEERLQATSATQREKRGTLRAAADGKLSFHDLAHLYNFSRQRVEGFVEHGSQVISTLTPLFADVDVTGEAHGKFASKRLGAPVLFTHTSPVSNTVGDDATRVCVCCECIIEPDDTEMVMAILDRSEVAWCSRECAKEFPIDAYLVANRYKRHWVGVCQPKGDPVDERSRVREITDERMDILRGLAQKQGY